MVGLLAESLCDTKIASKGSLAPEQIQKHIWRERDTILVKIKESQ
jgi:hypothetical protein